MLTGLPQIINTESFRPIINPSLKSTPVRKIPFVLSTTTIKPLTTISATLKSRVVSLTKPLPPLSRSPVKNSDSVFTESKDAPVAEALRGDYRRQRRPNKSYYSNYYNNPYSISRRRPNPKPYYTPPSYYSSPYEDYRFETDFLDQGQYVPKPKKKQPQPQGESSKDYGGIIDTDIGQFYDSSSATYHVGSFKSQENPSNGGGYYSSGSGTGSGGSGGGGTGYDYGGDFDDVTSYKYTTTRPKNQYKIPSSKGPSVKPGQTRNKYNSLTSDDTDYRYPSGGSESASGYGTSAPSGDYDESYAPAGQDSYLGKYNSYSGGNSYSGSNSYSSGGGGGGSHQTIYQTAPKQKPKPKPIKTTTTYAPPIKISDTSIDVLTKPLGSATFNLNLSPGTVYNPPQINYNPPGTNYRPIQTVQQIQPVLQQIPIQPPATSYGVPIAPPLNSYTYQNPYQNNFPYPPANTHSNYIPPSQISLTNSPGQFAEPPPLGKQQLADVDVRYNIVQSSYDATPKATRPTKRKPTKVNSKRVTPKPQPVVLNTDEELAEDEHQQNEYAGESYSYFKTMPQPALPNAYDQEEFHTVTKNNKRKNARPSNSFYYERSTKKPTTEVTLRIPDEDYLDDLVKIVQTTKRPSHHKKKSTTHTLDTEDLREAYESDLAYYPKSKRNRNNNNHNHYNKKQTADYDTDDEDDEENADEDYETDRVSHVNSKEEKSSKSTIDATKSPAQESAAYWDKTSSIYKQYGIRARNDNFQLSNSRNLQQNGGFRPIRSEDRSDVFLANPADEKGNYLHDIGTVAQSGRISSTLRSITTPRSTTLYVWDGKELPKNHKM